MGSKAGVTRGGLAYRSEGREDGAAVLFCTSLGTTMALWERQAGALALGHRVIRFDTRGHGASTVVPGEYSIDQLGADALEVLDAADTPVAHVCGISLGGLVTMWLGVNAPDRVGRLVIANTAARVGDAARWTDRIAKVRLDGMGAIADLVMGTSFTPAFRAQEPATVERFRQMVSACPPEAYIGCCAALRDADLRGDISRITARALVVAGVRDSSTTLADAERIRASMPGATLLTLDAAHLTNIECEGAFTAGIESFFTSPEASSHVTE